MFNGIITGKSPQGVTPNLRYVKFPDGKCGVVKPDLTSTDLQRENDFATICSFFGVTVSPCESVDERHFVSYISYNKRLRQAAASDISQTHALLDYREVVSKHIYSQLCAVVFVDCVCGQIDRHAGNLNFLQNTAGDLVGICPLYDNVATFGRDAGDECLLAPDTTRIWYHDEVFKWLSGNWLPFWECIRKYNSEEFSRLSHQLTFGPWVREQRRNLTALILEGSWGAYNV